jgi:hypothetical protein
MTSPQRHTSSEQRRLGLRARQVLTAAALSYVGSVWLGAFHHLSGEHVGSSWPSAWELLRNGSLALPAVLTAFVGVMSLCGRQGSERAAGSAERSAPGMVGVAASALGAALVLGAVVPLESLLTGVHEHIGGSLQLRFVRDAAVALGVCLPLAAAVWHLTGARTRSVSVDLRGPRVRWSPERYGRALVAVGSGISVVLAGVGPLIATTPATAAGTGVCASAVRTITYDVVAMQVDLPMNGWGDHVPNGMMYALANADAFPSAADIKAEPGRATPLVLRARVGDCITVKFRNEIAGKRVGMHVDGVVKAVTGPEASDGARIGDNDDTTAAYNQERTYTWFAQREGQFAINDYGAGTDFQLTDTTEDTTSHGLYGGLVVLPAGYTWHDPITGSDLLAPDGHGLGAPPVADARGPATGSRAADDFRDYAMVFMDEPEGICAPGATETTPCPVPNFPTTGLRDASFGFNYRTEPLRNRLRAVLAHRGVIDPVTGKVRTTTLPMAERPDVTLPNGTVILPEDHFCDGYTNDQDEATNAARLQKDHGLSSCEGEESHLQSWAFGDQGKLTKAHDETDVVTLDNAAGGGFTLTLKDPTLMGVLKHDNSGVDTTKPRFPGEVTTTGLIAFDATPQQVQAALMDLDVLPMAKLADGDIKVTGEPGAYVVAFGQHFAGHDVDLSADVPAAGQGGLVPLEETAAATATVSDRSADGGRTGRIEVLSDALIPKAYRGDPLHLRLIHPGVKETHPFHQHTNRWRQESKDPLSTRLDVQSIGPGQTFDLVYEGGAGEAITEDPAVSGSVAKSMAEWVAAGRPDLAALAISKSSNGDQIFHCHLYPHFAQGFWGALRVFDRQRPVDAADWPEDVPRTYADATPLESLEMLPDFDLRATVPGTDAEVSMTQLPDAAHPGYPLMLKGEYLQRAYRAPGAVVADKFGDPDLNWRRPGDTVRDYDSAVTTDYERANMVTETDAAGNKHAVPGAFFINPCPTGAPVRVYHPTAIDAEIVYNKAGWKDPDGKMYVEAPPRPGGTAPPGTWLSEADRFTGTSIQVASEIRKRIQAGGVQPEPYNLRSRLGECVNMRTTNATNLDNDPTVPIDVHDPGGNAFHPPTLMSELSTHVHLVRFDELATDGTSVGWNYVQAPMVGQTWNYKWFVDVALRTVYFHDHQNPNTHQQHGLWAAMNVEPTSSVWTDPKDGAKLVPPYCDGLTLPAIAQPEGAQTPACYGVGSVADIVVPGLTGFREFTVNYSDFVPMQDAAGKPINPPGEPDEYAADQGGMGINYRNEPFPTRVNSSRTGNKNEPAYVFSSAVHGDPSTPIFKAYQGDPVMFRFMGGAHEEGHNFTLSGHRWLHEPDDPNSNLYDSQFVMISEFFNMDVSGTQIVKRGTKTQAVERSREAAETDYGQTYILPSGAGAPGDYLYSSQPLNDLWMGMWGIFRVPAKRLPDLQPLPTRPAPASPTTPGAEWPALKPGGAIAAPPSTPKPCATTAPTRTYNISIIKTKITYNNSGDHDPNGVMYIENNNLDLNGRPKPGVPLKPLFIRASEGDCLNITLTNRLPAAGTTLEPGDPLNPVEKIGATGTSEVFNRENNELQKVQPVWPAGTRASVHPSGLVKYYAISSSGSAIGYNYDTTIAPGQSYTYKYYVDTKNIGAANLADYGNLRTNRHHGAWGGLIVEPKGSTYLKPKDLTALTSGEQAVVKYTDASGVIRSHREFVIDFQDGLNLYDAAGKQIVDQARGDVAGAAVDPEDQGEVGVNYRNEPFTNRLATGKNVADVFSTSTNIGAAPATPLFRAYAKDPAMLRILNSSDLPRVHTFGVTGHSWKYEQNDPESNVINGQGGLNTSRAFNAGICTGSNTPLFASTTPTCATAPDANAGDYLYNDRNFFHMLSGGIWGIIRVHGTTQTDLKPLPAK